MSITGGDEIAIATGGTLTAPEKPTAPLLSVTAAAGSVTATITGDSGVTHYLRYKSGADTSWQDGGSRVGDGDLTVSGLSYDVSYIFTAYSQKLNGVISLPSPAIMVTLSELSANKVDELLDGSAGDFLYEFGEPITYLPSGGGSRDILAIVDREPPSEYGAASGAQSEFMIITVANSPTIGISSGEVNRGGDKVKLPVRIGETARERPIKGIIDQDAGMMRLKVR